MAPRKKTATEVFQSNCCITADISVEGKSKNLDDSTDEKAEVILEY